MERKSLMVSLPGEGPRVLEPEEIGYIGSGWIEYWFEEVDEDQDYKALFHAVWLDGASVEVDEEGCKSYGSVVPDENYNRQYGWRIWDEKPSEELAKATAWEA